MYIFLSQNCKKNWDTVHAYNSLQNDCVLVLCQSALSNKQPRDGHGEGNNQDGNSEENNESCIWKYVDSKCVNPTQAILQHTEILTLGIYLARCWKLFVVGWWLKIMRNISYFYWFICSQETWKRNSRFAIQQVNRTDHKRAYRLYPFHWSLRQFNIAEFLLTRFRISTIILTIFLNIGNCNCKLEESKIMVSKLWAKLTAWAEPWWQTRMKAWM